MLRLPPRTHIHCRNFALPVVITLYFRPPSQRGSRHVPYRRFLPKQQSLPRDRKVLEQAGRGHDEVFDVSISHGCEEGRLRRLVVNPEVMHHYNPPDGYGYVSPISEADGEGVAVAEEVFEGVKGTTANMVRSTRCAALFSDTYPQPPTSERLPRTRKGSRKHGTDLATTKR
jgi:hypothetical protein